MNDGWVLWLVLVGLAIGLATGWLLLVRLPREESDIDPSERRAEAEWIGWVIERYGGQAPVPLVEEVLELHQAYLQDPRLAQRAGAGYPGAPGATPRHRPGPPAEPPDGRRDGRPAGPPDGRPAGPPGGRPAGPPPWLPGGGPPSAGRAAGSPPAGSPWVGPPSAAPRHGPPDGPPADRPDRPERRATAR